MTLEVENLLPSQRILERVRCHRAVQRELHPSVPAAAQLTTVDVRVSCLTGSQVIRQNVKN
jgi:hypothetical protein